MGAELYRFCENLNERDVGLVLLLDFKALFAMLDHFPSTSQTSISVFPEVNSTSV